MTVPPNSLTGQKPFISLLWFLFNARTQAKKKSALEYFRLMAGDLGLLSESYLWSGVESGAPVQQPVVPRSTGPARVMCVKTPVPCPCGWRPAATYKALPCFLALTWRLSFFYLNLIPITSFPKGFKWLRNTSKLSIVLFMCLLEDHKKSLC